MRSGRNFPALTGIDSFACRSLARVVYLMCTTTDNNTGSSHGDAVDVTVCEIAAVGFLRLESFGRHPVYLLTAPSSSGFSSLSCEWIFVWEDEERERKRRG